MRLRFRKYLKSFIYFIAALFILTLIKKRTQYTEMERLKMERINMEILEMESVLEGGEGDPQRGLGTIKIGGDVIGSEDADDGDDDINEDDEDDDDDEYEEEEDAGPDLNDLKIFVTLGHPVGAENVKEDSGKNSAPPERNQDDLNNFFMEREKVYSDRRKHIQQVCDRLGQRGLYGSMNDVPLRRLRWLNKRRLIMCFNAKVGTSTWTQYLMESGYPGLLKNTSKWHYTAERLLKPPHRRGSSESIAMMEHYAKVILVRDPFARIVSAYLDKIARMRFASLCRFIVKNYRNETSETSERQPTFKEFVRFLVDHTPLSDDIKVKRNHRTDRHWFHYYANCAPCNIHYNVIATMETVHEDTRYIIERYKLGITDNIWNNHKAKSSSEDMAIQLFQRLPRNLTMELYQRYRIDFLMFNYDVEKYLPPS